MINTSRPDIASGSLPVSAFVAEYTSAVAAVTVPRADEDVCRDSAELFIRYLDARSPHCFVLEQTSHMLRKRRTLNNDSPYDILKRDAEALNYSVFYQECCHSEWASCVRSKLFVFGISSDSGGTCAANFVENIFGRLFQARREDGSPTSINHIVDRAEEIERSAHVKDPLIIVYVS